MSRRGHGKGCGLVTDEDAALWEHAARSVEPLRKPKSRVHRATDVVEAAAMAAGKPMRKAVPEAKHRSHPVNLAMPKVGPEAQAGNSKAATPALQPFEPKRARKLRSGRLEIEARLDLHGMRQDEAHADLRRFLRQCHADGRRTVLVITGKGGAAGGPGRRDAASDRTASDRTASDRTASDWTGGSERGILKRNVPMWLAEPDIRSIVVSYTEAAPRHGGSGALYVHLRAARPAVGG